MTYNDNKIYANELRKAILFYQKKTGTTTTFIAEQTGLTTTHLSGFLRGTTTIASKHYPRIEEYICGRIKALEIA